MKKLLTFTFLGAVPSKNKNLATIVLTILKISTDNINKKSVRTERRTQRSETIFDNWKPFKNDEKCFLFHLESPFRSQDI